MYDTDKSKLENKILDTRELVKNTDYNVEITEIENKIASVSGLATTSALTAVENKILILVFQENSLQHKNYWNWQNLGDHDLHRYITAPEFNNLAATIFTAKLAQANLVAKTDFDDKLKSFNQKIKSNKTKPCSVKMNWKNSKHLIQFMLEVRVILKKMVHKTI